MQSLKSTHISVVAGHPSAVSDVLDRVVSIAPAPLFPGEKQADFAELALRIVSAALPRDAIEEFLVRDVVDLTWEVLRLRRIKAGLMRASLDAGVREVLDSVGYPCLQKGDLTEEWAAGDASARQEVDSILAKAGLTIEEVTANTLDRKIDSFERLDRMLASAEARRNNALREIDRHRDALGGRVRRSIEEIEDAEFLDVEAGEAAAEANA